MKMMMILRGTQAQKRSQPGPVRERSRFFALGGNVTGVTMRFPRPLFVPVRLVWKLRPVEVRLKGQLLLLNPDDGSSRERQMDLTGLCAGGQ
jgi:acyl dehydratase